MRKNTERHLTESRILHAVVDEADLLPPERSHLAVCPECRTRKDQVQAPLLRLGQLASRFSPKPSRRAFRFTVPQKRFAFPGFSFGWRPAMASALGVLFVIAGLWWISSAPRPELQLWQASHTESMEDSVLMAEVEDLIETGLPVPYRFIAADDDPQLTEDFMLFVAPVMENNSLTFSPKKRGFPSWYMPV